jgi:hypothetical protein
MKTILKSIPWIAMVVFCISYSFRWDPKRNIIADILVKLLWKIPENLMYSFVVVPLATWGELVGRDIDNLRISPEESLVSYFEWRDKILG